MNGVEERCQCLPVVIPAHSVPLTKSCSAMIMPPIADQKQRNSMKINLTLRESAVSMPMYHSNARRSTGRTRTIACLAQKASGKVRTKTS